jgi:hypothetical protein
MIIGPGTRVEGSFLESSQMRKIKLAQHVYGPDHLCGLRILGYRAWCPEFYSRCYQIFWEVEGLEWGSLSLLRITEELLHQFSSYKPDKLKKECQPWMEFM